MTDPVELVKKALYGMPPIEERDINLEIQCEEHKLTPEQRKIIEDWLWGSDQKYYKINLVNPSECKERIYKKYPKVDTTLPLRAALMATLSKTFPYAFWVAEWHGIRIEIACVYELAAGWREMKKDITHCVNYVLRAFDNRLNPQLIIKKIYTKRAKK